MRRVCAGGRGEIAAGRVESSVGANATELCFCSIHHRIAGSLSCVQHASKHAKNPLKPMIHALRAQELTNPKTLDKKLNMC